MNLRKIKDYAGVVLSILTGVLLLGVVYIPLYQFGRYANIMFKVFLVVIPIYLLIELYFFTKDSSKRREGTLRKKKKSLRTNIIEWTLIIILIIIFFLARNGSILEQTCPATIQGNPDAEVTVKYFSNSFCISCWAEEANVQTLLDKHGNDIRLERYDYRYCYAEVKDSGVRTMPGYVFQSDNETEVMNAASRKQVSDRICEKVGCEK